MCGRFALFDEREIKEIHEIIQELEDRKAGKLDVGEIFPTNRVPILISSNGNNKPVAGVWGFPHFKGSGVIINARSETAHIKPMFRKNLELRRCLVPGTGFYEWSRKAGKTKQKYLFTRESDPVIYMAGLYNVFGGELRFVILTTEAGGSVRQIHDRMPVVLDRSEMNAWLLHPQSARDILADDGHRPALMSQAV